MGLTIHYSLKTRGTAARARKLVNALHQAAQDLPFKELGEIVELSGEQCDFDKRDREDPLRWLLIQADGSVDLPVSAFDKLQGVSSQSMRLSPTRVIAFTAWPGEGCEQSNIGLCQYPATIDTDRGPIKTRLSGWRFAAFCKTQYSSDPGCGGVPHFLQCHLSVIALLDKAKELGCLDEVSDEGGFWEKRDLPELVRQIGSWNEMIAAFGGVIKDLVGDGPMGVASPITQYPDFEQLEAAGQDKLPPGLATLAKLIQRTGREVPTT
jgi:hypothetical protein